MQNPELKDYFIKLNKSKSCCGHSKNSSSLTRTPLKKDKSTKSLLLNKKTTIVP